MRIRLARRPSPGSGNDLVESLLVDRIYNLPPALASALMLDGGYAGLYDTLSPDEKRERSEKSTHDAWTANDHPPRWNVSRKGKKPQSPPSSARRAGGMRASCVGGGDASRAAWCAVGRRRSVPGRT